MNADRQKTGRTSRIAAEASPYTIIRVGVMRTKLLDHTAYHQLLHLTVPEILLRLQESDYAKEINAYALSASTLSRLDDVLERNMVRTMEKLRRICDEDSRRIIDIFAMRSDMRNLKTLLRAIRSGIPPKETEGHIIPSGVLDAGEWADLVDNCAQAPQGEGTNRLLDALEKSPHAHMRTAGETIARVLDAERERSSLAKPPKNNLLLAPQSTWENALDQSYHSIVNAFIAVHGGDAVSFDEYFTQEIDIRNIVTIIKLVREGLAAKEIMSYVYPIIGRKDALPLPLLTSAAQARDLAHAFAAFTKTRYGPALARAAKAYESTGSLVALETELSRQLLEDSLSLMHRHPLSVDVILGYLLAKSTEVRNLNSIVRGKGLDLGADEIEAFIITLGSARTRIHATPPPSTVQARITQPRRHA